MERSKISSGYFKHSLQICSVLAVSLLIPSYPQAQVLPPQNPSLGANLAGPFNPVTSMQFLICGLTVIFGLIVLCGQFILLRRVQLLSADDIVRNCTISLVIIGALILIIAGYDSQQTAQAFDLFGTIIGYLLGRSASRRDSANIATKQEEPEQKDA